MPAMVPPERPLPLEPLEPSVDGDEVEVAEADGLAVAAISSSPGSVALKHGILVVKSAAAI